MTQVELADARVVVAGLGITGRAVVSVLRDRVASVLALDTGAPDADIRDADLIDLTTVDLVIASPGWAPHHPFLTAAAAAGVAIWSEVELAWRLRVDRARGGGPAPWLAVTGTNGKTTTIGMLGSILRAAGHRVAEVGNVGTPVIEAVLNPDLDVLAVELSSFQLHFTHTMAAHSAAVLNLAPDHLDWHGDFESYATDKGRIYAGVGNACVYCVSDPATRALVEAADVRQGARAIGFTAGAPGRSELGVVEDVLCDRAFHLPVTDPQRHRTAEQLATLADLEHLGAADGTVARHTLLNALAAAALARSFGVGPAAVQQGLQAFHPGAHRIAHAGVLQTSGEPVTFVDDSKATNAHAASASLSAFRPGSVVWLAGGLAKGAVFDELIKSRADRLRAVVLIGVEQRLLHDALTRHAPQIPVVAIDPDDTGSVMTRAVEAAIELAEPGDTVLLAPACASMDQFPSYAERGRSFVNAIARLTNSRDPGV